MSLSQPRLTNPADKIFTWAGGNGVLSYWDREAKRRVPVPLPFSFIVLDQLACVTGFSSKANAPIWSNEIRVEDLQSKRLLVQTKGEILYDGIYQKGLGGREYGYTQAIYIAYYDETGYKIGKINATGTARSAWFDFTKTANVERGRIFLEGKGELQENGATKWYPPVFKWGEFQPGDYDQAIELDRELQDYLKTYFKTSQVAQETGLVNNPDDYQDDQRDLPTEQQTGDSEFDSLLAAGTDLTDQYNPEDLPLSMRGDS